MHGVRRGTASQPHEHFVRWQRERAVENERLRELAEAGVTSGAGSGAAYVRPGDDAPMHPMRSTGDRCASAGRWSASTAQTPRDTGERAGGGDAVG